MSWKIEPYKVELSTPIWTIISESRTNSTTGNTGTYYTMKAPNWVSAIIKNIDTGKFILVSEFRHGIKDYILEFPSGTVEDENSLEAIIREVKEETGYSDFSKVVKLFEGNPNTAFMDNKMTGYYLEVTGNPGNQELDSNEDISIVELDINEVDTLFKKSNDHSISQQLLWVLYKEKILNP